jgi:hypothetical protein
MNFQKFVLMVATILLIGALVVIGVSLSKGTKDESWPPIVGECPDYWVDLKGNGEACFNSKSLGKCNVPSKGNQNTMDFTQSPFNGENGACARYKWASACQVTWDGITSGVKNPCDTTAPSV